MRVRNSEGGKQKAKSNWRLSAIAFCLLPSAFCLPLTACYPVTRPTLKLALVAPFEGRYRDVGYEINFAVRLAIREANQTGGVGGYSIELLALDDSGDPLAAAEQARKVSADPSVIAVLGHWLEATTLAAAPIYDEAAIPLIATTTSPGLPASAFRLWLTNSVYTNTLSSALHCPLPCDSLENLDWLTSQSPDQQSLNHPIIAGPPLWQQPQFAKLAGDHADATFVIAPAPLPADSADPGFANRYRAISSGVEPRSLAVLAYDATRLIFDALARDVKANGTATRAGVVAALVQSRFSGLSGKISFDSNHNWVEARGWVYQWKNGEIVTP
jgi:ABC-type branched-subunit amino acid transport system substrate-binding protein